MKLAIHGGPPVRIKPFPAYQTIGREESVAVQGVLDSGVLSKFLGAWHDNFYGGSQVRALEEEWADYFGVKHAIAVNSCTSGLYAAVGAVGTNPGDEIVVSPYTMSASAVAPLVYQALPVFADIEDDYFCLDPVSIEKGITDRTKAIIVVDIFGQPYDAGAIQAIANRHGLFIIEDAAQAPSAKYDGKYAGTLGDIGVFSLNYHKHIHCGEGGVVVTDNDELAEKVRLIRNHAESVVAAKGSTDLVNMLGFNYRMTEIEAAIARCQLKKLAGLVKVRQEHCDYLSRKLGEFPALMPPAIRPECEHVFYVQAFKFDEAIAGVARDVFIQAVKAELTYTELRQDEGVKIGNGYVKPVYWQPLFQAKVCFGKGGAPFAGTNTCYKKGLCPVTERMHEKELFYHELMHPSMTESDLNDVVKAFEKVWENRAELMSA